MAINADVLLDRIRLKNRLRLWRFLAIIFAALLLAFFFLKDNAGFLNSIPAGNYIARVPITGMILDNKEFIKAIEKLKKDKNVKAVILDINSPGGTTVGGEVYYETLVDLQKEKPLISTYGTLAASAAYLLSMPSDRIFARKASLTGSIGVIMKAPNFGKIAEKVGYNVDLIRTGNMKGEPSPYVKMSPEVRTVFQESINDFYDVFVDIVAKHRKLSREEVVKLADGRIYTGLQASKNGLVDSIGGEKEAVKWLQENKQISDKTPVHEVTIHRKRNLFLELFGSILGDNSLIQKEFYNNGLLSIW